MDEKQFGFQKIVSTTHAIFSVTGTIKKVIDDNILVCGIFIDLQKTFHTVDHEMVFNLEIESLKNTIICIGSPLFFIYMNGLHNAIKFSRPLHFADDTCLLNIQKTILKIDKLLKREF